MLQGYHYWQNSISKSFPFNPAQKKSARLLFHLAGAPISITINNLNSYLFEVKSNIDGKIVLCFHIT